MTNYHSTTVDTERIGGQRAWQARPPVADLKDEHACHCRSSCSDDAIAEAHVADLVAVRLGLQLAGLRAVRVVGADEAAAYGNEQPARLLRICLRGGKRVRKQRQQCACQRQVGSPQRIVRIITQGEEAGALL
jgi:hypothetical protein